jgi:signal transduction histidine kinase
MSARFDERLDERTRMARELHDTFLQTVQGSKMVADDALASGTNEDRMRNALVKLSTWLGQAVTEGRAALHALRASSTERNQIAEFLERTLKEQCHESSLSVALTVVGDPRELHPIVRDEISLIAKEAIHNACLHSKASQLRLDLRYADDLRLCFKDNGIGIDPNILETGRAGHFGLQGMKERSARIRAKITISSSRNTGTEVILRVPGEIAYERDDQTLIDRFKALFQSRRAQ